jgi:CheY-like chemotaxis protein
MVTYAPELLTPDPFFLDQLGDDSPRDARILVAEDDPELRCLLASSLREDGYEVVEAENSIELLQRLEPAFLRSTVTSIRREFDLVISDIHMRWFSALAVLTPFRKRDPVTPLILIASLEDEVTLDEARSLGAAAVIEKPVDLDQVRSEVRRIVPGLVTEDVLTAVGE